MPPSERIRKATAALRKLQGTPAGSIRDALAAGIGATLSLETAMSRAMGRRQPHPLFRLMAHQTGEPYDRWPLSDLAKLRSNSEELLEFLPKQVKSARTDWSIQTRQPAGQPGTVPIIELTPDQVVERPVAYLHGGGFVMGSAESILPEADAMARMLGSRSYAIGYPLAPEFKLPEIAAATVDALRWVSSRSPDGFYLVGESAGGYLGLSALLTSQDLADSCRGVVLFYPLLDLGLASDASHEFGSGFMLTRKLLEWFVRSATPTGLDPRSFSLASLSTGRLSTPILIECGEFDPLVQDWQAIASIAPVLEVRVIPGLMHGFMQLRGVLPERDQELRYACRYLASAPMGSAGK